MKLKIINRVILFVGTICLVLISKPAVSCNVPVFQYALERWHADLYDVFVFHQGNLSAVDSSNVKWLEDHSFSSIPYSNFTVHAFDIESEIPGALLELWESLNSPELPCLVMLYPRSTGTKHAVWRGRLTLDNAKSLATSPMRQEIGNKILEGVSVVWVLLECGNRLDDDAAADTLQTQLKQIEQFLSQEAQIYGVEDRTAYSQANIPYVQIRFSIVRLSRNDPLESHFISMLTNCEPDLSEYSSYPMAFPIYGRGRVLYSLVGKGINEQNIYRTCAFLTGPCSCEFKALNPGIDLLMTVDWETGIVNRWAAEQELPPLVGLTELAQAAVDSAAETSSEYTSKSSEDSNSANQSVQSTNLAERLEPESLSAQDSDETEQIPNKDKKPQSYSADIESAESSSNILKNILIAISAIIIIVIVSSFVVGLRKSENK